MKGATMFLLALLTPVGAAGQLTPQRSGTDAEFRALHAASASVVWAGGQGGRYAVTVDGGTTWRADSIRGAGGLFFTGIWAQDGERAHVLGTAFDGGLARIYSTSDGGRTWTQRWESSVPGTFMDALRCWSFTHCVAFGDPVDGSLDIVRTTDGRSWSKVPRERRPATLEGEAGFAASGTAMTTWGERHAWIGTGGGTHARVFMTSDGGASWSVAPTPLPANATTGIFGIAFVDSLRGVAVGGDYSKRTEEQQNVMRTNDGGRTWSIIAATRPHGVRYGIAVSPMQAGSAIGIAPGPSGVGITANGTDWTAIDTTHYNTVAFAPSGEAWVAGPGGRIARVPPSLLRARAADTGGRLADAATDAATQEYPTRFTDALATQPMVQDAMRWLEGNFEEQVREWVRITETPGMSRHEQQRGAYVKAQLEAEGFIVSVDSLGNVVARRPGTGGGETVVLAAHMDTVHPLDTDVTVSFDSAMVNGRMSRVLRAPGIFDNSASVSNMLALARALNRANIRTRGDIIFIATVQEELGLLGMDYWLEQNPGVADVLVALDGGLPNVNYGALGIYWTKYMFRGEGSHTNTSAGRPHPARALADAIRDIYTIDIPAYMGGAVYNVGMLDGGKIYNAIPEEVSFTMDLRSVNPILLNDLDAQIDSAVARAARAHNVEWAKEQTLRNRAGGTEQMLADRRAHPLIQTSLDIHEHFGIESRAIASGSTDANAGVVRGIPSISIGRAVGGDQHTLSEWSEVDSALPATKIALLIAIAMAGLSVPGT